MLLFRNASLERENGQECAKSVDMRVANETFSDIEGVHLLEEYTNETAHGF